MRRFVTETQYRRQGASLQVVTVYPTSINKKQVKKELELRSTIKGMVIKESDTWRYEGTK
jgi:hypothetical protein